MAVVMTYINGRLDTWSLSKLIHASDHAGQCDAESLTNVRAAAAADASINVRPVTPIHQLSIALSRYIAAWVGPRHAGFGISAEIVFRETTLQRDWSVKFFFVEKNAQTFVWA